MMTIDEAIKTIEEAKEMSENALYFVNMDDDFYEQVHKFISAYEIALDAMKREANKS